MNELNETIVEDATIQELTNIMDDDHRNNYSNIKGQESTPM